MGCVLVTGASGFVGRHVLDHLAQTSDHDDLWASGLEPRMPGVPADHYVQADLTDAEATEALVHRVRPQHVIHLAGAIGRGSLAGMMAANVKTTENLYLALAACDECQQARIVQAGTAAVYGRPEALPVTEESPCNPLSEYARSKAAQEELAVALGASHGLGIVRARMFNILGPGQGSGLVPMTFLQQLRDDKALRVGDISTRRDFVDVRDVAAALVALLTEGTAGRAYNVASGSDVAISAILDELIRLSGLDVAPEVDAARLRPTDVPVVRADISRITRETSWHAAIAWQQSLKDMWNSASP